MRMHYTCSLPAAADSGPAAERAAAAAALRGHKTTPVAGVVAGDAAAGGQGTVVENSRKNRRRPLEFVVGEKQVVKGIDRVIMTMLYGERAKVTVTAGYAYGDKGYPPIVPPRSPLVFDLNLLNFWPRPRWQKPLVQVLSEPYREVPYARREPVAEIVEEDSVAADVPYGKWRK